MPPASRFAVRRFTISGALLALALACAPALAKPWKDLTPIQQEALAPLSAKWDALPEKDQHYYLRLARRYPSLSSAHKKRMRSQLEYWSKLTPQQREQARQNYRAFRKVPPATREKVKEIVQKEQAEKAAAASAPGASADVPATN